MKSLILAMMLIATDPLIDLDRLLGEDLSGYPGIMPTTGVVSSDYGFRRDPFTRRIRMHKGIDICNARGTVVVATGAGTVIHAGWMKGYGYAVEVRNGRVTTLYGHLCTIGVYVGEKIRRGQPVGCMGDSGRARGVNTHYEIRIDGVPVDPNRYLMR